MDEKGTMRIRQGKLTEQQKIDAAARYLAGETCQQVADAFGVKQCSMWEMLKRRNLTRPTSVTNRRHTLNERAFDTITPESAYWVGFLITDGCLSDASRGSHQILLQVSEKDVEHLHSFKRFLGSDHPISPRQTSKKAGHFGDGLHYVYNVRACGLAAPLIRYGVTPRKTATAAACDVLAFDRHFWRGCIDGDGTVSIHKTGGTLRPYVQLCGASRTLLEQFSAFVRTVVPSAPATVRQGHGVLVVSVIGHAAIALTKHLYADCTIALPRKLSSAREIMAVENTYLKNVVSACQS
jgi:hypothetical protein